MNHHPLSRRDSLRWFGAAATMMAASALPATLAFAAPVSDAKADGNRLVVVMLRGALDGLAAVPAVGDPAWADLRGHADAAANLAAPLRLDSTFAMHPALVNLHRWYTQKDLLVVHATASAYRERSHFDAQQLLESGGDRPFALQTGWLGRALQSTNQNAMALTAAMPLALRGGEAASTWTPERRGGHDPDLIARVAQMYAGDPALHSAFAQAMDQQDMTMGATTGGQGAGQGVAAFSQLAKQAGVFLADPKGPRVAWLEAGGWDTHTQQGPRLQRLLAALDDGLEALRAALGIYWAKTTVLVMTEFGRSARYNGTGGTDHGTGSVAFVAGGAVAGGRVQADWPGLSAASLLDGRDLKPTLDLRALIAPALQRQFGLSGTQLQTHIFPGMTARSLQLWRA